MILYRGIRPIHSFWEDTPHGLDRRGSASAAPGVCVETTLLPAALDGIPLFGVGDQGVTELERRRGIQAIVPPRIGGVAVP